MTKKQAKIILLFILCMPGFFVICLNLPPWNPQAMTNILIICYLAFIIIFLVDSIGKGAKDV